MATVNLVAAIKLQIIPNSLLRYFADCPDGALVIVFTGHDIENTMSCPKFVEDQCVDRLLINIYGGVTSCGPKEPMIDFQQLSLNELRVTFQTNGQDELCGFNMNIHCVPFTTYDTEACVFPPDDFRRGSRSVKQENPRPDKVNYVMSSHTLSLSFTCKAIPVSHSLSFSLINSPSAR